MNWKDFIVSQGVDEEDKSDIPGLYKEAREFLEFYNWVEEIRKVYVGMMYPGVIGIFLFHIKPARDDVDEWMGYCRGHTASVSDL